MCYSVVNCVQFDEDRIVSGSADGTLRIWSSLTGGLMYVMEGHKGEVVRGAHLYHSVIAYCTGCIL